MVEVQLRLHTALHMAQAAVVVPVLTECVAATELVHAATQDIAINPDPEDKVDLEEPVVTQASPGPTVRVKAMAAVAVMAAVAAEVARRMVVAGADPAP